MTGARNELLSGARFELMTGARFELMTGPEIFPGQKFVKAENLSASEICQGPKFIKEIFSPAKFVRVQKCSKSSEGSNRSNLVEQYFNMNAVSS